MLLGIIINLVFSKLKLIFDYIVKMFGQFNGNGAGGNSNPGNPNGNYPNGKGPNNHNI
jgi:hypothetical protein